MSRWKCIDNALYLRDDVDTELWSIPEDAPSIDIVRCGECKNFRRFIDTDYEFCDRTEVRTTPNDFCSYGEREDE